MPNLWLSTTLVNMVLRSSSPNFLYTLYKWSRLSAPAHLCGAKKAVIHNLEVRVRHVEFASEGWNIASIVPVTVTDVHAIFIKYFAKVSAAASRSNHDTTKTTSIIWNMQTVSSIAIRILSPSYSGILKALASPLGAGNNHLIIKSWIPIQSIIYVDNVKVSTGYHKPTKDLHQNNHEKLQVSHSHQCCYVLQCNKTDEATETWIARYTAETDVARQLGLIHDWWAFVLTASLYSLSAPGTCEYKSSSMMRWSLNIENRWRKDWTKTDGEPRFKHMLPGWHHKHSRF